MSSRIAATEEEGSAALDEFAEKWDKRYPQVSTSWKKNWAMIDSQLMIFFQDRLAKYVQG
jgi:transposase-like protein